MSGDGRPGSDPLDAEVEAARSLIQRLLRSPMNGEGKVFAFPPDYDLSPAAIQSRTRTRREYDHFKKRLAATLRQHSRLGRNLAAVAARILEGKEPRFRKTSDRKLMIIIGMAVAEAVERGLPKYRNEASAHETSACDVVARAARQCGLDMTYDKVAHRYRRFTRGQKLFR